LKTDQGYTALDIAKFPDYAPNDAVIHALEEPPAITPKLPID
jgi:hypothetical protein